MEDFKRIQSVIGYNFKDLSLLKKAFIHSSYASEHKLEYRENNERLEFIGDAYLDAIVGHALMEILSSAKEGNLSRKRSEVVCEGSLADAARKLELGKYMLLGNGEDLCGGREKDSILADAFEALLGAIIIDGGFEEGKRVVLQVLNDKIRASVAGKLNRDFKSKLQETIQEHNHNLRIRYALADETGPDHNKTFTINVVIGGEVLGTGIGTSKSRAEQAAACEVLKNEAWKGVI